MGTRHLICIYYKGRFAIAQYAHWDGYPSGSGMVIYRFLMVPGNVDRLKVGLSRVESSTSMLDGLSNVGVGILELIADADAHAPLALRSSLDFALDNLFCEWIYVIDLDCDTLEVYSNYNDAVEQARIRFAEVGDVGLGLVKSFRLTELPENAAAFVDLLESEETEEGEGA